MENKQSEKIMTANKHVFTDIGLDNVATEFKRTYVRNRGTLGQHVYSLNDMIERLDGPTNDYQNTLYPKIQQECKNVVSEYNKLLSTTQKDDYYLLGYYLNGAQNNGKRKAITTHYEKKSYGVSEYKETLKSINDRLRHIKFDCIRKSRDTTRTDQDILQRIVIFCDEYHTIVNNSLEEWNTFITDLRNTNGIIKKVKVKTQNIQHKSRQNTKHKLRVKRKQHDGNSIIVKNVNRLE